MMLEELENRAVEREGKRKIVWRELEKARAVTQSLFKRWVKLNECEELHRPVICNQCAESVKNQRDLAKIDLERARQVEIGLAQQVFELDGQLSEIWGDIVKVKREQAA